MELSRSRRIDRAFGLAVWVVSELDVTNFMGDQEGLIESKRAAVREG